MILRLIQTAFITLYHRHTCFNNAYNIFHMSKLYMTFEVQKGPYWKKQTDIDICQTAVFKLKTM